MPTTTDKDDRLMVARLGRAFANPDNAEWASAYFDTGTHAGHTAPNERARHEAHVAAVQQLHNDIAQDHAAARASSTVWQPVDTRPQLEAEIRQLRNDPSYANAGPHSAAHRATMDRISYLYRQLHPDK